MDDEKIKALEHRVNENSDFDNLSFQIDLINTQVMSHPSLVDYLNENSSRLQHLLDEEPRLIRWWFDNIETAMHAMTKIDKELNHRLICVEKNALFIQL